jgi:hypothetical protein
VRFFAVALLLCACTKKKEPEPAPETACAVETLDATRLTAPLTLDGKFDEEIWHRTPVSKPFKAVTPKEIVTHTEVRALWDEKALYVGWYAADEDIGSKDVLVTLVNGKRFELTPSTHTASAVVDSDGSLDDPNDDDEEWLAEQVITWKELGLSAPPKELPIDFLRDDQPKNSHLRHQRWNAQCPGPGVVRFK